jgi:pyruvate kinase
MRGEQEVDSSVAGGGPARSQPGRAEILCTLGPASMGPGTIRRLERSGASLFRINLSHTSLGALPQMVETIRAATAVPVCLDTEGAQIRTGELVFGSIQLRENTAVRLHLRSVPGDDRNLNLYPRDVVRLLEPGDFLSIDFNSALAQVVEREGEGVLLRVLQGGLVGQNKGVNVERDIPLPALTAKDEAALAIGRDLGVDHVALSFARRGDDVRQVRAHMGEGARVIAKIESRAALEHLEEIAAASDALLIDRGDLSRQVPIELLPRTQKRILERAKAVGARVYVATNLLESMVSTPHPTRAEVNDIYNTLADGADGLVLAAETAIGSYPVQCANMVRKVIECFEGDQRVADDETMEAVTLLPAPHGGSLVQRVADARDREGMERLRRLTVADQQLMDCEQLAQGTYSPLTGFMGRHELDAVLADHRLPDGEIWPLPILLPFRAEDAEFEDPEVGERVALTDGRGTVRALLDVTEDYRYDLDHLAHGTYGTTDRRHPGVAKLYGQGDRFLAGDVTLVTPLPSPYRHYFLMPAQTRFVFGRLGWSEVVAFHTRNPAHRGHESIQLQALERTGADGIYVNPVASPEKAGDFLPGPILLSYQTLIEFGQYPPGKVVLGSFFTYARYAGPREAVFSALCRKNMGCRYLIVGRDHTGVGDYYAPTANRELFEELGDLGIEPVFFDAVGYNAATARYETDIGQPLQRISGSQLRQALRDAHRLPDWFVSDVVQEVLLSELQSGRPVFRE